VCCCGWSSVLPMMLVILYTYIHTLNAFFWKFAADCFVFHAMRSMAPYACRAMSVLMMNGA
jgi:hypothetical protein